MQMSDEKKSELQQLSRINQIGIVVKDVEKAAEHYTKIGLGPFNIFPKAMDVPGFVYHGKPTSFRARLAFNTGTPQIELIQCGDGEWPNSDFLKKNCEGISHFGYNVDQDDFDKILAELAKAGVKPIFQRIEPNMSVAYLDTDKIGGVMIELIGVKKKK
jgi:catechol 2,3-dioxygenase-like lactoylglutathione lyase family enzyme